MRLSLRRAVLAVLLCASFTTAAFAQSGSINGTVKDAQGAVLPGVDVAAKNNATGEEFRTIPNGEGNFTIPALGVGVYTVTVSLQGFKTAVLPDVPVIAGTPAS